MSVIVVSEIHYASAVVHARHGVRRGVFRVLGRHDRIDRPKVAGVQAIRCLRGIDVSLLQFFQAGNVAALRCDRW